MNLIDIKTKLNTLNIPVAYDHFKNKVNPPFIAYRELPPDVFLADDYNYLNFKNSLLKSMRMIRKKRY